MNRDKEEKVMIKIYVALIRKGLRKLEEVPEEIRAKVEDALKAK